MKKTFDNRIEYFNDKEERHRTDGPAIEYFNSENKLWYLNGKHHREDGPAIEYGDGNKLWYLSGEELTEQEFNDLLLRKRLQRIIEL